MRRKQLYLVLHHEIIQHGSEYVTDEMVFQIASSLQKALEYIRTTRVDSHSWWEIQVTTLDNGDWPEHYGWYGHRGGKLKKQPYEKALAAYKRCKEQPSHHLNA